MARPLVLRLPRIVCYTLWECLTHPRTEIKRLPRWLGTWRNTSPLTAAIPWISFDARDQIEAFLDHSAGKARVFEYGSGGSTLWYAKHAKSVDGVEHDPTWYDFVRNELKRANVSNCSVTLEEPTQTQPGPVPGTDGLINYGTGDPTQSGDYTQYVRTIDRFDDDYFDLVVVDGRSRQACLIHAAKKVRPGGMIYLDDADRSRYQSVLAFFAGWEMRPVGGIRPLSLPNRGLLMVKPKQK